MGTVFTETQTLNTIPSLPTGPEETAAEPEVPPERRKKRKSVEEPSAHLPPSGDSIRARDQLLSRISTMTGLPRGCIHLEQAPAAEAGAGSSNSTRIRVHIKCTAMLQPVVEWNQNQAWLRRQGELAGVETEAEDYLQQARANPGCLRKSGHHAKAPSQARRVGFSANPPEVMEVLSSNSGEVATNTAEVVKSAAEAEADPAVHFAQAMRLSAR